MDAMQSDWREIEPPPEGGGKDFASLVRRYGDLAAAPLLRVITQEVFPGRIAVVSSFGAESVVLLDLVAGIDPAIPVIFLDTGRLFDETLDYVETLRHRLGLRDLRIQRPGPARVAAEDADGTLWQSNVNACCHFRKVATLTQALSGFSAWITGRKRFHGGERANLPSLEVADGRIKVNPLTNWPADRLEAHIRQRDLPRHPLVAAGYGSLGCAPCTRVPEAGEDPRAGRWAGTEKTECGIHDVKGSREMQPLRPAPRESARCRRGPDSRPAK